MRKSLGLAAVAAGLVLPVAARADETPAAARPGQISLYQPTYFLPAVYVFRPDDGVYGGTLPDGQSLNTMEIQYQFSVKIALAGGGLLHDVYAAYTQTSFWQLYRDSAFFRETDYQPELLIIPDWRRELGAGWTLTGNVSPFAHQSNGRGGSLERSWDRTMGEASFARRDGSGAWTARLRPWIVWRDPAYRRYNPNLARYLGYGRESIARTFGPWELELALRNQLESGFRRGSIEATASLRLGDNWSLYGKWFNGFGQSLIEYDHATNALGLGFAVRAR